jgi:hypothetical protein
MRVTEKGRAGFYRKNAVKLSFILAGRVAVTVFLVAVFMIPLASVLNRVFDHTWFVDWRFRFFMAVMMSVLIFVGYFLWTLIATLREYEKD